MYATALKIQMGHIELIKSVSNKNFRELLWFICTDTGSLVVSARTEDLIMSLRLCRTNPGACLLVFEQCQ